MRPTIVLINLPKLISCGVRYALKEFEVQEADNIDDALAETDAESPLVVMADLFALNCARLSAIRRGVVVILNSDSDVAYEPGRRVRTISIHSDANRIREVVNELIGTEAEKVSIEKPGLSGRETEVLKEIASGKTFKEIADTLSISVNTVVTHRKNISAKLGIRSTSGLSVYAIMNGLI